MSILDMYNENSNKYIHAKDAFAIPAAPGDETNSSFPDTFQENFLVDNVQKGQMVPHTNYIKDGLEYFNADYQFHKIPPVSFTPLDPTNVFYSRYHPVMEVTIADKGRTVTATDEGVTYYSVPGSPSSTNKGMEGRD